ncbi:uncharacterized protein LOC105838485 isoform X2 [Monomorium pharaonis]|uniref:uncharacterized protein LOC105838485 isoform X2 n=1 Tax=Monomorium pharaonis TaxID=307658 RepID=UPI00063F4865|nr:uncharacterized protein LOC105838485 isoform X2 [Monomorium pharaonis]
MTVRHSQRSVARTSLCLLAAFMLFYATNGNVNTYAFPQVESMLPGFFYGNPAKKTENIMLANRLKQLMEQKNRIVKQEHEINDEQIEIQTILEAKEREQERAIEQSPPNYPVREPELLPRSKSFIYDSQDLNKRGLPPCDFKNYCPLE